MGPARGVLCQCFAGMKGATVRGAGRAGTVWHSTDGAPCPFYWPTTITISLECLGPTRSAIVFDRGGTMNILSRRQELQLQVT